MFSYKIYIHKNHLERDQVSVSALVHADHIFLMSVRYDNLYQSYAMCS